MSSTFADGKRAAHCATRASSPQSIVYANRLANRSSGRIEPVAAEAGGCWGEGDGPQGRAGRCCGGGLLFGSGKCCPALPPPDSPPSPAPFPARSLPSPGDAYMAVGGLPEPQADHTARVARFALEAVEARISVSPKKNEKKRKKNLPARLIKILYYRVWFSASSLNSAGRSDLAAASAPPRAKPLPIPPPPPLFFRWPRPRRWSRTSRAASTFRSAPASTRVRAWAPWLAGSGQSSR